MEDDSQIREQPLQLVSPTYNEPHLRKARSWRNAQRWSEKQYQNRHRRTHNENVVKETE